MHSFDRDKLKFLPVKAQLKEVVITEQSVRDAINFAIAKANEGKETASVDPVGENQKPRMLQVTAWICHAGAPNLNDAAFLEQDLSERVNQGLFVPPFFGMIDYNHDFSSYGAWYKAQYAYDTEAKAWGILAEGAIFAWRYGELADKMLAMQARQGHIDVSMACMPEFYENAETAEGRPYVILRKPVFFTTSLLDVPPADTKGRGLVSEETDPSASGTREAELRQATLEVEAHIEEDAMAKKKKEEAAATETTEQVETTETAEVTETTETAEVTETTETAEVTETTETATETTETETEEVVTETAGETEEGTVTVDEILDSNADLAAEVDKLKTEKQTLEVTLAAANTTIETLNAQITDLAAYKTARENEDAVATAARVRETRMAELPEAVKAEMEKEENKALLDSWMTMEDASWSTTKKLLSVASAAKPTLAERSEREGMLSGTTDGAEGGFAIHQFTRKRNKK